MPHALSSSSVGKSMKLFSNQLHHILPLGVVGGLALYDALEAVVKRTIVGVKVWRLRRLGFHFHSIFDGYVKIVEDRVKMKTQSAQSPYFNANDCAFYNSLQCIVQSESTYNYNANREDMTQLV